MKICLQWATTSPTDYLEFDLPVSGAGANRWRNLPKKPVPVTGAVLDALPGWYADLCIQGVQFTSWDHLAAQAISGGLRITAWNDDLEDFPVGTRHAQVWEFYELRPDPAVGGRTNTHQLLTVYAEDPALAAVFAGQTTTGGPVVVRPWSEFVAPASALTIHGVWMTDAQWEAHVAAKRPRGWREWGP